MIRNPFDITQYTSSFVKDNITLDSKGIQLSGIGALMEFLVNQVRIRQEAIRIGYISNNPSLIGNSTDYDLIPISNLTFDDPASLRYSSFQIVDAVKQMFKGHNTELYEKLVYQPTIRPGATPDDGTYESRPGGFFHQITDPLDDTETPKDSYFESINDPTFIDGTYLTPSDLVSFNTVPEFTSAYATFNDYIKDQVFWANSAILIINKLKYIHKKLVFSYPFTATSSSAGCAFAYTIKSTDTNIAGVTGKPIEVILDMSEVVNSCNDGTNTYGYLCVKWASRTSGSRFVVMPTRSLISEILTAALRLPLWGAQDVDPTTSIPYVPPTETNPRGYLDPSKYNNLAAGGPLLTWEPEEFNDNIPVRAAVPILLSGCPNKPCCTTDDTVAIPPFRDGNTAVDPGSDYACIKITGDMFSTGTSSDWDNKIRIVIFPGCESQSSGANWELMLTCLGCTNCTNDVTNCGGVPVPPSSSSSSNNQGVCNFSQNVSGREAELVKYDIDATGAPTQFDEGGRKYIEACLKYKTRGLPDRVVILATKTNDEEETRIIRSPFSTTYTSNYYRFAPFNTPLVGTSNFTGNPYFNYTDNPEKECPKNGIIFDSGCVSTSVFISRVVRITEDQMSFEPTDQYYKKFKLLIFNDCEQNCDPVDNPNCSVWELGLSCETANCTSTSSSSSSSSRPSSSSSSRPSSSSSRPPSSSSSQTPSSSSQTPSSSSSTPEPPSSSSEPPSSSSELPSSSSSSPEEPSSSSQPDGSSSGIVVNSSSTTDPDAGLSSTTTSSSSESPSSSSESPSSSSESPSSSSESPSSSSESPPDSSSSGLSNNTGDLPFPALWRKIKPDNTLIPDDIVWRPGLDGLVHETRRCPACNGTNPETQARPFDVHNQEEAFDNKDCFTELDTGLNPIFVLQGGDRYGKFHANSTPFCDRIARCPDVPNCNCFGLGTTIAMADGTYKTVENIKPGDELLSVIFRDPNVSANPNLEEINSGWTLSDAQQIRHVKTYVKDIVVGVEHTMYKFSDTLYATYEHPFLIKDVDDSIKFRSSIYIGNGVYVFDESLNPYMIGSPKVINKKSITIRITTEPYNCFFAGDVLVHSGVMNLPNRSIGIGEIGTIIEQKELYRSVYGTSSPRMIGVDNGSAINKDNDPNIIIDSTSVILPGGTQGEADAGVAAFAFTCVFACSCNIPGGCDQINLVRVEGPDGTCACLCPFPVPGVPDECRGGGTECVDGGGNASTFNFTVDAFNCFQACGRCMAQIGGDPGDPKNLAATCITNPTITCGGTGTSSSSSSTPEPPSSSSSTPEPPGSSSSSCEQVVWNGFGCPDIDGNGIVGSSDIGGFLGEQTIYLSGGTGWNRIADFNGDDKLDGSDFATILGLQNKCVTCPNWPPSSSSSSTAPSSSSSTAPSSSSSIGKLTIF